MIVLPIVINFFYIFPVIMNPFLTPYLAKIASFFGIELSSCVYLIIAVKI